MDIVVGHANPDFDAYASTIAATKLYPGSHAAFLGTQNANVRAFHNLHEGFFDFVELKGLDLEQVSRVIMVDTRDPDRIGEFREVVERPGVEVVVWDHHPPQEGDLKGVEEHVLPVGATTSILVHEIRQRSIELTRLEATALLLGIHEDTGSLTYLGATAYDADAVAFLMAAGADLEVVNEFLTRQLDAEQRDLLGQLTDSLEVWDINGQDVAVGHATTAEYVDSASVLTHYIVEDLGYRVAIAVVTMPQRTQVVARSRLAEVDVGAALARIGGGGHAQAASAGFRDLSADEALRRVRKALLEEIQPPLTAADVMSHPVRTVTPDTSMREAGALMRTWGHGGLPVLDAGALAGLVTRKDVDKAERHGLAHAPVKGFMNRDPVLASPTDEVADLERLLATRGIGRVPVMSHGRLVGIVTRKDVLSAEHGAEYLTRREPTISTPPSQRFLGNAQSLLPADALALLRRLGELASERGLRAHVVGGFVRDMLLGRRNLDMDVTIEGDGVAFAEDAARELGARVKVHRRFGTAVLVLSKELHVDVTSARTEYYTRPGALPTVERSSLRQDLFRRDFTLNAMAACINADCFGSIADPFGGMRDLDRGVLRVLHTLSFVEDPTRVLRAARFECRYGFTMDAGTEELARSAVELSLLSEVSGARIREELLGILDEERPSTVLLRLAEIGALSALLPDSRPGDAVADVGSAEAAWRHLCDAFVRSPRRRVTLVASLAGAASGVSAERWLHHMRFGREYGEPVLALARRGTELVRALRDPRRLQRDSRLFRALDPLPPETVVCLWARSGELGHERIERFIGDLSRVKPAVSGEDLIALGAEPGAGFSAILSHALDDRLDCRAVGREAELANLAKLARKAKLIGPRRETA